MSARTNRRRRKQAANGYNHLAKLGRPIYGKPSPGKQAAKLRRLIERERQRQARKATKK